MDAEIGQPFCAESGVIMKIKLRARPDEIQTLIEALKSSDNVIAVTASDMMKYAETNVTGSVWLDVQFRTLARANIKTEVYQPRRRATKGEPRAKDGYVYLLKAENGTYKIGKTVNPKSRRRTFNVRLPFAVEYSHIIHTDDMGKLERLLHQRFSDKRLRGSEFFQLTDIDVAFIVSLGVECKISDYMIKGR